MQKFMYLYFFLIGFTASLLLQGCKTLDEIDQDYQKTPPPQAAEISYAWDHKADSDKWTLYTRQALRADGKLLVSIVPDDYKRWCSNYPNLSTSQREQFWIYLISQMAKYESSHKPSTTYAEGFKNGKGETVISTGLLQISYESARAYKCLNATTEKLKDPKFNLSCGVKILSRWVPRDKNIGTRIDGKWLGGARYWSVMRPKSSSATVHKIRKATKDLEICK